MSRLNHLDLFRVIAMFCVMLFHSPFVGDAKAPSEIFALIQFLDAGAVPAFFLLSGYLGARKINSPEVGWFSFLQEKFHTLIVPFLFWNALVLSLVLIAKLSGLSGSIRGGGAYFDVSLTFASLISALLGIGRSPIVYQFWFLRDLIVVSLIAFGVCRYFPRIPLLPWLLFLIPCPMVASLGFYLLGHDLKAYYPATEFSPPKVAGAYCVAWVALGWGVGAKWLSIPYPLFQLGSAACLFFLALTLYPFSIGKRLAVLGSSTFMVYAMHEPTQTIIARIWQAMGWPGYGSLLLFLLIPLFVFPLCVGVHYIVLRFSPRLLPFLTGGR